MQRRASQTAAPNHLDQGRLHSTRPVRAGLIIVVLLTLGWLSLAVTLDQVLGTVAPALAERSTPWGVLWKVQDATLRLQTLTPLPADVAVAEREGRRALNRSPVRAAPARVIGDAELQRGHLAAGMAGLTYAVQLSRRDLPATLAMIERCVAAGDVRGALHYYNLAMITVPESRAMLTGVLIGAANSTPQVAHELARLLATRPTWLPEFYQRFTSEATDAKAVLDIAQALHLRGTQSQDAPFISMALQRLVQLGAIGQAQAYYRSMAGTALASALVRNGGFERPSLLAPFDWMLVSEPSHSAIAERRDDARGTVLTITGSESQEVARQLLVLPPGRYRLAALAANIPQAVEERPKLTLTCLSGQVVLSISIEAAGAQPRRTLTTFSVPPGTCAGQWLGIRNTAALEPPPAAPWIDDIQIVAG